MDRRRFITTLLATCLLPSTRALAGNPLIPFTLTEDDESASFVIELEGSNEHNVFTLDHPPRVVIDLPQVTRVASSSAALHQHAGIVEDVRTGQRAGGIRIVLDLKTLKQPKTHIRQLGANRSQLIVSINDPDPLMAAVTAEAQSHNQPRKAIIEIDAGHGGKDPGCISADDHYEKYVAMGVADYLKGRLDTDPRFEPSLTRDSDIFIPLHQRVLMARNHHADLFISIHADAAPTTKAAGASVYILSEHGASSATARWLAESQNSSDRYASTRDSEIYSDDPDVQSVLIDLSMRGTDVASQKLARTTLNQLGSVTALHNDRVNKAAFAVLKSPDIPSMLVETGFMSNRQDCRRLLRSAHQQELAEALHQSVADFFEANPIPG
ncbi:AMIN domain-containing protein [Salinicola corii]|uniref:N-acetylmuramoyl-L-alanine amidase n=1 Tax=Salinicola corii TaxID=2606937 RepID=A0A640WDY2_9GAMM|nr:N-acetylmuramoyl-L-alanine amidase [Salinicola corii]KAA0018185.1 AMIN domain-containing protein [Salinicola corii]